MRVVCINESGWFDIDQFEDTDGPKYGDIDTVDGFISVDGITYFTLVGYNSTDADGERERFDSKEFRPVDDTYGEVVCKTIEEQIEYQEAIKQ